MNMPGMDGMEVCTRLRMKQQSAEIPVIFLTADTDTEHKVAGLAAGARDYITKPFDPDELLLRVKIQLRQRRKLEASDRRRRELDDALQQISGGSQPNLEECRQLCRSIMFCAAAKSSTARSKPAPGR